MIRRPPRSTQSRSSAASDVYKRQGLRRLAVLHHDAAAGRAGGVRKALELEAGDHVGQPAVAVPRLALAVEELEARRHDDGADVELDLLVLLLEVDRPGTAG